MRSRVAIKIGAGVRFALVHGVGRFRGDILINEYPRSGGTWIAQMLADLVGLSFPRNRLPGFRRCILHGHYLSQLGIPRVVIVWRDGRDVMVSSYFHSVFKNARENAALVDVVRRELRFSDYSDVRSNLPKFIEYTFTRQHHPAFSWADFVRSWQPRQAVHICYEDARRDTGEELLRVVKELTGLSIARKQVDDVTDKYSFSTLTKRAPGVENRESFMRKGIVGDWRNQFTQEAAEVFDYFAGDALIQAGYEHDHSWVKRS